jgi:hypothetical protein
VLLCDDILSDANSGTQLQRDRTWEHFTATLLPMHAKQVIVLGTAQHAGDLLFRWGPPGVAEGSSETAILEAPYGFRSVRYRALDEETETALWPWKHSAAELLKARADGPTVFSREYQNDPRDDTASLFPHTLTDTLRLPGVTFLTSYRRSAQERVVMGEDLARSEATGADYTVQLVVAWNMVTQKRRLLYARPGALRSRSSWPGCTTRVSGTGWTSGWWRTTASRSGSSRSPDALPRRPGGSSGWLAEPCCPARRARRL